MDKIIEFVPAIFAVLIFLVIWFVIRRIVSALSDKINNSEIQKEEMLTVLQEIRDELKELNKKKSSGNL
ncbi:hypothetical protein [Flavobacterium hungaricum]|uniref:Phage shock protein B n=1 Tax=Flavobacterium hungaricum TaxID=2082725 RepID=A0ABR9TMI5_9FLAO|nr:hypothetical protein [Flavobacterium hungaricum]MBE8726548.1 hypothetical protein [Flavobacterium hungaricum]